MTKKITKSDVEVQAVIAIVMIVWFAVVIWGSMA